MDELVDFKSRCQSCGMPLGEGFYGTTSDGTPDLEYCKFCFQNGVFVEPDLKLDQMINRSAQHMVGEQVAGHEQAMGMAQSMLPQLKRWRVS